MSSPSVHRVPERFREWVEPLDAARPISVLCHNDVDGLAAGALLTRALRRRGFTVVVETTGKGEHAWHPAVRERLQRAAPQALLVADLGSRAEPVLPGVPTLLIDHHRPDGLPPDAVLLSGYGSDPVPTSGLLAYWACAAIAPIDDLDWIAAISLLGDIGDDAPFAILDEARRRWKITPLRDATALLNAPRRSAAGDARPALDLLLRARDPREVTRGDHPEVARLKAAKAEVNAAFAAAKQASPRFSGTVAMIWIHSACQVHPLIAQIWRTWLATYIVMAVNSGYLPGRVNFSVRAGKGTNVLEFLREHAPAEAGDAYGHGHDQASGGSLPYAQWNELAQGLGFGPDMLVDVPHAASPAQPSSPGAP
ncbi:MAG TPA: hypothetical protein VLA19_07645 [Herpetosiphonaceae bacterium]|nr:hypothetical protein [Herpetosiphonaceae bacterium]